MQTPDSGQTQALPPPEGNTPATSPTTRAAVRVGVFDSGLGGLSVLRALRGALPDAELLYVADSAHAPYGEREEAYIQGRSQTIVDFLTRQEVDAVVVACNTATAAAIHALRLRCGDLPVIGVEPGIKPAVAASVSKRVGVLATPGTLSSDKFRRLLSSHAQDAHIVSQACPGLAKAIEAGELDTPELRSMVARFCAPLLEAQVDTVVLGCTHYPFISPLIGATMGSQARILDTAEAVARQTARVAHRRTSGGTPVHRGSTRLWSSADPAHLQAVASSWLGLQATAHRLPSQAQD